MPECAATAQHTLRGDRLALTIRKIGRKSEAPAVEGVAPGADGDVDGGDDEDDDTEEE